MVIGHRVGFLKLSLIYLLLQEPSPLAGEGRVGGISVAITTWLSSINPQIISLHKSPCLGNDIRWDDSGTAGFVSDYNDEAVNMAVFAAKRERCLLNIVSEFDITAETNGIKNKLRLQCCKSNAK